MDNAVKTKIDYEVSQIDELIDKSDVLISLCKNKEPDFIEITAVGGILHAFTMELKTSLSSLQNLCSLILLRLLNGTEI